MRFRDVKALWEWALFSKGIMYFDGFLRIIIWGLKGKYLAYKVISQWYHMGKKRINFFTWERWRILFHQITILFSVDRHKTRVWFCRQKIYIYIYQIKWVTNKCHKTDNCYFYIYLYFSIDIWIIIVALS